MAEQNHKCSFLDDVAETAGRVARGTVAGFLGGMLASWVMNQYQAIESRPVNVRRRERELANLGIPGTAPPTPTEEAMMEGQSATVRAAQAVSRKLFDHDLTPAQERVAGPAVHLGYGATVGALYGGLSELIPIVGAGLGIPYAAALWLGGDEIAVPALGLSKAPTEVRPAAHASELATHFVYGITLDISRRILRRIL